ncbi:MAG: hypothetical protein Q8M50_06630, partial [Hydrogenophaga sp.]|nr:hypothetical protein [Hydrogenophaga sp.]
LLVSTHRRFTPTHEIPSPRNAYRPRFLTTWEVPVDGLDAGTLIEIGYALARGMPVVIYCENESEEDLKMMAGSGCILCTDYVSAIYRALWTAISI